MSPPFQDAHPVARQPCCGVYLHLPIEAQQRPDDDRAHVLAMATPACEHVFLGCGLPPRLHARAILPDGSAKNVYVLTVHRDSYGPRFFADCKKIALAIQRQSLSKEACLALREELRASRGLS